MATNVEIEKKGNENTTSVIRRFSREVRESGVLRHARSLRYRDREPSDFIKKKQALKRIEKTKRIERLRKLGILS